jgi:hypothetical protein
MMMIIIIKTTAMMMRGWRSTHDPYDDDDDYVDDCDQRVLPGGGGGNVGHQPRHLLQVRTKRISLKGIVSQDEYFLKVLKIKRKLVDWPLMVFTTFSCFLRRKSKRKFLLASMKSLTNYEEPSSNPPSNALT